MKKIFILEASQGSYDEYHKFIIGVYDNKENAEIQKKFGKKNYQK